MALLDFLKNKKQAEKAKKSDKKSFDKAQGKPVKKSSVAKKEEAIKEVKEISQPKIERKNKNVKFSYDVIKAPHISEKATYLSEKNQYTFEVMPQYSKQEIKKAVEGIYGVDVLSVNLVRIPRKKRRLGRTEGFRKSYKKAIVKIKEGQKIEIL